MSEIINNRSQETPLQSDRLNLLNELFDDLYNGKPIEEVKADFDKRIGTVAVEEIAYLSKLQREFIEARDLPKEEIERISAAHMSIIKGHIQQASEPLPQDEPGHPVHTFKLENRAVENVLLTKLQPHMQLFEKDDSADTVGKLMEDVRLLLELDKHYIRKEHLIFPYLEKCGIKGPSVNMWRVDDYIRDSLKEAQRELGDYSSGDDGKHKSIIFDKLNYAVEQIIGMIYREENILFPMSLSNLTEDEWVKIAQESGNIGYCLIESVEEWMPERNTFDGNAITDGYVRFETGVLSLVQLEQILNHLPVDITFIDHEDVVRYFSHGKERIFPRTKAVIGRTVQNCHPPKSIHIVEQLLSDFKSGAKDVEQFWIQMKGQFIHIRYFAVRNENGEYLGTLEFTQNIGPIQAITGEKRIMS